MALVLSLCFFLPAVLAAQSRHQTTEFAVAPDGSDSNPGSLDRPFATLERAREAVRAARGAAPGSACTVFLTSGTYERTSSFLLESKDGGDSLAPVRYTAARGVAVRLAGGKRIGGFRKVTDASLLARMAPECAGHVFAASLRESGIHDYGRLRARGFGRPMAPSGLELFFNDVPMTLARWPNDGWATIGDTLPGSRETAFVYEGDRPRRWVQRQDVWLHGYWTWDWADSYTRVAAIDTNRRTITTAAPHGVYGYTPGKRFYALNVLEAFAGEDEELGITELSRRLRLHKNNIFRILATLESRGYVEQNSTTDNYRLGLRTLELGQIYIRHTGLLRVARPVMEELNRRINENIYIGILKDKYAFYLDVVESTHTVRVLSRVGCRIPTYCSAIGKAQLAFEPPETIANVLSKKELKAFTPKTLTDRDRIIEHLALVKELGYSIDDEEWDEGVRCVGAPILDYTRKVVGALSISGPSVRVSMDKVKKELVPLVKGACEEISTRLGYKALAAGSATA